MNFDIHYLNSVDSTNDYLKEQARQGAPEGMVIWASEQTRGRGQRDHAWISLKDKGLYFSILLRPEKIESLLLYTLFPALAMVEWLREKYDLPVGVKWPNDVYMNNCKLCGVLTEARMTQTRTKYIIIGIGMNVNHSGEDLSELENVTSMRLVTGRSFLLKALLTDFQQYFIRYYRSRTLMLPPEHIIRRWMQVCVHRDEWVTIIDHEHRWRAEFVGLDPTGKACVKTETGKIITLHSGIFSLRRDHDINS